MVKPCCPKCQSDNLHIVGCFVYSETGIPITPDFSFLDLKDKQTHVTQLLILCEACQSHFPLKEAENASYVEKAIFWEKAVNGRKRPVICPVCKNAEHFVKERLVLSEQTQIVQVMNAEHLNVMDTIEFEERDTVTLCYRCGVEGCTGIVTINEDTFKVTPL